MSTLVRKLADSISCHAWNGDRSALAVCPGTNELWIYTGCHNPDPKKWKKTHTLGEHDLTITGVDWHPETNRIVTCGQDRTAYVWDFDEGQARWLPTPVVLRFAHAVTCVAWSPDGLRIAAGSSSARIAICSWDEGEAWWNSRLIKQHKSTVTSVAWHPSNQFVATTSTDFKCRIFSVYDPAVNGEMDATALPVDEHRFAEEIAEFDQGRSWCNSCDWSPDGKLLAFASQGCEVFVVSLDGAVSVTAVRTMGRPFLTVRFLSNSFIAAGGFDMEPVFIGCDDGSWAVVGKGAGRAVAKKATPKSGFGSARAMFAEKASKESGKPKKASSRTKHMGAVVGISALQRATAASGAAAGGGAGAAAEGTLGVSPLSTVCQSGRIVVWAPKDVKLAEGCDLAGYGV